MTIEDFSLPDDEEFGQVKPLPSTDSKKTLPESLFQEVSFVFCNGNYVLGGNNMRSFAMVHPELICGNILNI